jgi:DNA-binding transcriptional regulator YiaG
MSMFTGKQIAAIREALGMSRTQFAALLDVSEGAVWRWECDDRHPRFDTMRKINELAKQAAKKGFVLQSA